MRPSVNRVGELAGPGKWKGLCQTGSRQSPVNLPVTSTVLKVDADMGDFDFAYGALEKTDVLNTGHGTMQVRSVLVGKRSGVFCTPDACMRLFIAGNTL